MRFLFFLRLSRVRFALWPQPARSKTPSEKCHPSLFLASFLKHPTFWASQTLDALLDSVACCCQIVMPHFYVRIFLISFSLFFSPLISPPGSRHEGSKGPEAGDLQRGRDEPPVAQSHQRLRHLFFSDHRSPISSCPEEIRHAETSFSSMVLAPNMCYSVEPRSHVFSMSFLLALVA